MANPSAAVMVLDHYPSEDEIEMLAEQHLEDFPSDYATATVQVVRRAPDFMSICEQDQINAHVRDGGNKFHVLIVYMQESEPFDDEDDEEDYDEEE